MPAVALCESDMITTGHLCDTTAKIQGNLQTKVSSGGKFLAVQGDDIEPHTHRVSGDCVPHAGAKINSGSSKVFISGRAVARVGDSADGGSIQTGSANISAG